MRNRDAQSQAVKDPSDIELMLRVKADDNDAFSEIVNRYQTRLHQFFHKSFPHSDAEDLSQEVFDRLWRARKQYNPTASFDTYLFTIARRTKARKIRGRKQNPLSLASSQRQYREDSYQLLNIPDKRRGPLEELIAKELNQQVREAISILPEKQKEVMELILEGLTESEIARQLGCSRGTVSSRKTRATARLEQKFKNEEEGGISKDQ